MYFRNYELRKTWLDKCLKSTLLQYPSTSNMVNRLKHFSNLNGGTFTIFLITGKAIEYEKFYLSDMRNLKTVC